MRSAQSVFTHVHAAGKNDSNVSRLRTRKSAVQGYVFPYFPLIPCGKSRTQNESKRTVSPKTWDDIEEVEPNEVDLAMLKEVEENSDCHEFISQEEAMKELGL